MNRDQLDGLINAWLDGRITEGESEVLQQTLRGSAAARSLFKQYCQVDAELRRSAELSTITRDEPPIDGARPILAPARLKGIFALGTVAVLGLWLLTAMSNRVQETEEAVARITGLSGPLRWTGDAGQVVHELKVGAPLPGGTIDGLSPEAWFQLEFLDGSTVTISGYSMLTFSDVAQKELYLKAGSLSAKIAKQPPDKPMRIYTHAATLTVLGTSFDVEAGMSSTALNVIEGQVQLHRLSDRESIKVPAMHRLVATADEKLNLETVPKASDRWKSSLRLGPGEGYGTWSPGTDDRPASMRAIPFVPPHATSKTLYLIGLQLSKSGVGPLLVKPGSRLIVRGRLKSAAHVFFGMRMTQTDGEFAGKFFAKSDQLYGPDSEFEAEFDTASFKLDPSVHHQADELPRKPEHLLLAGVWCFTNTRQPAGLEIFEVELVPPSASDASHSLVRSGTVW